ncbi:hypothetical protein PDE_08800 [Penicillium oxalicum 114-2]|uniref:Uncharacterized protein n=1 Tax=Penicillium oxalicum (strain 114-2 / CGMCC 5302) TaxID=933388 RepID=S8B4W4_PENO1|nr:hypothetical protein PDE_08800 [Penicillium oxalicum 114-2]
MGSPSTSDPSPANERQCYALVAHSSPHPDFGQDRSACCATAPPPESASLTARLA